MRFRHRNTDRFCDRHALTTVELLVSTMLASMLMVALLGVLRGLRVQAAAMENIRPSKVWQTTLDQVFQFDLENSRRYQFDRKSLTLTGFAGRDPDSKSANWKPTMVTYEIVSDGTASWLIRREKRMGGTGIATVEQRELVLSGVHSMRLSAAAGSHQTFANALPQTVSQGALLPITDGLTIELWSDRSKTVAGSEGGQAYAYRFRQR